MTDPCVLQSPDFNEKVTLRSLAYGKYIGELLPGSKQLKKSKILLNEDTLKNILQKKYIYMSFKMKTIHLVIKQTYAPFCLYLRFHMTLKEHVPI